MSAKPTPIGGSKPIVGGTALGLPFSATVGYVATYPSPGSFSFRPTRAGYYKFCGWGAGGGNDVSGSGAYFEITEYLDPAKAVAITVGLGTLNAGTATTVTLPSGRVATANGGLTAGAAVTATGGDVNLSGSVAGAPGGGTGGGAAGDGGGAPANLPFRGGDGGGTGRDGRAPGGGSGVIGSGSGAHGQVIVIFDRL